MTLAIAISVLGFVVIAAIAHRIVPLSSRSASRDVIPSNSPPARKGIPRHLGVLFQIFISITDKIRLEYYRSSVVSKKQSEKQFWNNIQILRLISAYAIVYIHLAAIFNTLHVEPALLDILRFGTDLFVILAGFLSAHVLGPSGKSAPVYLRDRVIRIVPLYFLFTLLAFLVKNYGMTNHTSTLPELLMSLTFLPYGPYPILHPTWTLEIIVEYSLIIFAFQFASRKYGVYLSSFFVVILSAIGASYSFSNSILELYTNPILIDFALGTLMYQLIARGFASRMPKRTARLLGISVICACSIIIMMRPFYWPEVPRLLGLGVPASGLLLGAVLLENVGASVESKLINLLAKCSYAIYLCHWFVNIVSEKIVSESGGSVSISIFFLIFTPVIVTTAAIFIYLYVEAPITKYLINRLAKADRMQ